MINGDQNSYSASNSTYGYESGVGRLVTFQQDTVKYDSAGNEIFRTAQPTSSSPRSLRDVASYYSADGKLRAIDSRSLASDDPMAASFFTRVFEEYRYDALGRRVLARSRRSCDTDPENAVLANEQSSAFGVNLEEFRNDALGNVLYRKTQRTAGTNDAPFVLQYNPLGSLRQWSSVPTNPPGSNQRNDDLGQTFENGGQLIRQSEIVQNPNDANVDLELAARNYYGADDKLMVAQRYSWRSPSFRDGTWEEYWYDALGRRILTRALRDPLSIYDGDTSGPLCMGGIQCRSFTERVWWDGDQALVEERTAEGTLDESNSGVVGNIHGLTLDEPLAVMSDQTRIVNYNWRGLGESSVFPNGTAGDASLGNVSTEIDWPAATQAETYFTPGPGSGESGNAKKWMGTFVANGQGTTGMLYRRNRYFSPNSGQFTQADPIGIAGGMNAFGFAGGDPVNFSDPFGLLACPPDCGFPGDPRNVEREAQRFESMTNRDRLGIGAMVVGAGAIGVGAMAVGAEAAASAASATFFRGVSGDEAAQIGAEGVLKAVSQSVENAKYVTNSAKAAAEWGMRMHGEGSKVVQITVRAAAAKSFEYLGRIDGIGEAWKANMSALKDAVMRILP